MDDMEQMRAKVGEYNRLQRDAFASKPVCERILFISHCINRAKRDAVKEFAEGLGYRVFVVGGGSIVRKKIASEKPSAVVGIACFDELKSAAESIDVPYQVVLLDTDGCENTDFNLEAAKAVLRTGSQSPSPG